MRGVCQLAFPLGMPSEQIEMYFLEAGCETTYGKIALETSLLGCAPSMAR